MKMGIYFLSFLIPLLSNSQSKSSIDFILGIEYSYRIDHNSYVDSFRKTLLLYPGESGKLNFRIGFNYNRKVTDCFWLKTGLRFASIGYNGIKQLNVRWGSEIDPATGVYTKDPNLPHELQLIYDFRFLEIPIMARYAYNTKKINPFIEFGFSPNIYLTTRVKEITEFDAKVIYLRYGGNFNTLNISSTLSIGINYHLNEKVLLFGQLAFRYHITPLVDALFQEHLYNYGFELGIRKQFS